MPIDGPNALRPRLRRSVLAGLIGVLLHPALHAQEALRISRVSSEASVQRRLFREAQKSTLDWGEGKLRLGGRLSAEYNSNITFVEDDVESDFIFRPEASAELSVPVTDANYFGLAVTAGYSKYASHSEYDRPYILPGSEISFDLFIKDVRLTIEDRFDYFQDPAERPVVTGTAEFGGFQNVAGISGFADLNDLTLSASYNHLLFISTTDEYAHLDRSSHQLFSSASITPKPFLETGIQTGFTPTQYFDSYLRDNLSYSAGVFAAATVSTHINVSGRAGAVLFSFSDSELNPGDSEVQNFYFGATVDWRLRKNFRMYLDAGQETQLGVNQDLVEMIYLRNRYTWTINRRLAAQFSIVYEDGEEGGSGVSEDFRRLIVSPSATWNWNDDWYSRFAWSFAARDSSFPDRGYDNHRVTLTVGYQH